MVQMGRIFQAPTKHPERSDQILLNAKKKMGEATDNFHSTLDEMEMEIVSRRLSCLTIRKAAFCACGLMA